MRPSLALARRSRPASLLLALALLAPAFAGDWPGWRGPRGNGTAPEARNLPETWSTTENVKWKQEMPAWSGSTPTVWGDRIFLNTPSVEVPGSTPPPPPPAPGKKARPSPAGGRGPGGQEILLLCLDRATGRELWRRQYDQGNSIKMKHNMSSPSPVTDGKLTGVKIPVTDGAIAHVGLVLARENGKPGLFLVDLTDASVTRETLKTLDPTRDAARLTFANTPVRRLGEAGEGVALVEQVLDRAAILLAFEQCGGADRCLEFAKDYAMERYAFGRVIASYQAIKHKLADMYVKNELARSNAYYGAWALNTNAPEMPIAASAARIAASEAFWYASKENIQTHGGIGFTWEMDCHLFYRRSRQLSLVAGAPRVWKERLVSHLERRNAA